MNSVPTCPEVSDTGFRCQKKLYVLPDGEAIDHAGGHFFSTPELASKLHTHHYDPLAVLSMQPVEMHAPEDCPNDDSCAAHRLKLV